ncbi:MAG: response regulator [Oscillospiraceae bacterium]|nr:response regulator [Oscillospiraceae bacterium]
MEGKRKTVLIVDDNQSNLATGKNLLKLRFEVYPVPSAARMFELLQKVTPDLILLDVEMPETDGYEAIKCLKANRDFADIPVIFLTSKNDERSEMYGLDLGATDYIFKPFSPPLLIKRIENQLLIAQQKQAIKSHAGELTKLVSQKNAEVHSLQNAIIMAIANLMELRDKYTGGHIARVQSYVKMLIEGLVRHDYYMDEISMWNLDLILPSVQLYDIGKIGIPESILNKPGELNLLEREIMRTHVDIGIEAVNKVIENMPESGFLRHALHVVGSHHEKWDGTGYPKGLREEEIPLEARLLAVADVYDALISWRPYKKAYTHDEAKAIIEDGSGTHFDPVIVHVFRGMEKEFYKVTQRYRADAYEGE